LELARTGQPDPFQQLIQTLRAQGENDRTVLLEALGSPDETLRRAAVAAVQGRTEADILQAVVALARDPSLAVRQAIAYALAAAPWWPRAHVAELLLLDHAPGVRQSAVWAARRRPALEGTLVRRLGEDANVWVRLDIANALAEA